MKRVLLTGASGYIGRHMPDDLVARGYEVHAISHYAPKTARDSVIWHQADLLDTAATNELLSSVAATDLIHLAWVTEPGLYWESPENDDWLNASVALLESFEHHGGQRAVLTGTCAEYDWSHGDCIENKTPLQADSKYARKKQAFREKAFALSETKAISVAWARVFLSFGPHEHPDRLVPAVILALLAGERAKCSDGSLVRDFMYVPDVAKAMVAVLDSDFCGDINIASGDPRSLQDIVGRIAARMGAQDRIDFGHYPRRSVDPDRITADVSRLRDTIGWTPEFDFDSAIDQTIAWWKDQAA